jgi:DNA topoisomerase-1
MSPHVVPALRYVDDVEPGLRRIRRGRGFQYRDPNGRVPGDATIARIRRLAIPPAWEDVWICADADGHIQATGRDARGRKQYRYHDDWRAFRDRVKFDKLVPFGTALPDIRRTVEADLRLAGLPRPKILATVVRLLETTLVRVGNEEYARDNRTFGLTTLRHHHVAVGSGEVSFRFAGKGGRTHEVVSTDRRVARVVSRCQELPGQRLFQYVDGDDVREVHSHDVNEYLRASAGIDVTAKDYRTWTATLYAASGLACLAVPATERERTAAIRSVVEETADALGNTPTVCRASYIHPIVFESFASGVLQEQWAEPAPRAPARLTASERRLLAMLRAKTSRKRQRMVEELVTLEAA